MSTIRSILLTRTALTVALCLCLLWVGQASSEGHDARVLQSVHGDRIALDTPTPFACDYPPCPARICIATPLSRSATALSIGTSAALTRRVEPGGNGCIDLAPVLHRMTFWAEDQSGQMRPVLTAPLDLRESAGTVTWAHWLNGSPQSQRDRR